KRDDTVVFFLSDNGANPKQPEFYQPNTPEQIAADFDNSMANMGREGSFVSIGGAWAEVADTPLSYFKTTTYEGGTQTPFIVAGGPVTRSGVVTNELLHVANILPTMIDMAGVRRPSEIDGEPVPPLYGRNLAPLHSGAAGQPVRTGLAALSLEMHDSYSVLCEDWKLLWMAPPYGDGDRWQLFNLAEDPRELEDLSVQYPGKVAQLEGQWQAYAEFVGYIESDGTSAAQELGIDRFFEFRLGEDCGRRPSPGGSRGQSASAGKCGTTYRASSSITSAAGLRHAAVPRTTWLTPIPSSSRRWSTRRFRPIRKPNEIGDAASSGPSARSTWRDWANGLNTSSSSWTSRTRDRHRSAVRRCRGKSRG